MNTSLHYQYKSKSERVIDNCYNSNFASIDIDTKPAESPPLVNPHSTSIGIGTHTTVLFSIFIYLCVNVFSERASSVLSISARIRRSSSAEYSRNHHDGWPIIDDFRFSFKLILDGLFAFSRADLHAICVEMCAETFGYADGYVLKDVRNWGSC